MADVTAPVLLRGGCNGASFEITMVGHITDKPFQVRYSAPAVSPVPTWHDDLGVAARAATKWLMRFHPVE